LATNAVLHTGISSGCIACHGAPNASAPVFYLNYTPKDALLSPVHIPTSTTPCEACHTATVFTAFSGTTMSSAKHTSMFAVIAKTCDQCHDKSTLVFYGVANLQTRPGDHKSGSKLTNDCNGCHNTNSWGGGAQARPAATATKAAVAATVSTVNAANAVQAQATAASAVAPASAAAIGVRPGSRPNPHLGVTGNCVSCHNGATATGKGARHVASNDQCANCHTTIAWLPARFDHRGIAASCTSCHNGVTATGMPVAHIPTRMDCGACHGTFAWRPARFSHAGIVGTCAGCHNTLTGLGKPIGHVATTLDCSSCHTTLGWIPATAPNAVRTPVPTVRPPAPGPRGVARGQN
ncbi:MAG TPA: cytochrome c3 family protein, partial [Steroidobacteraceae bacterium]|nr:cytochrome c3 family protein [Steroidobacteraceae bacterium]